VRTLTLPEHLKKAPVGVERLSREELSNHQRGRMVAAAIQVFAKRGFPQTTIEKLAAAAESSVGTFYSLFDGKEDCFLQCYDLVVTRGRARIEAEVPDAGAWADRLCAVVLALLREVEAEPLAARVALVEVQTAGPRALERYEQTLASLVPLLRPGRNQLPAGERLPSMLEEASVAGSAWLLHQRLARGEASGVTELLPEFLSILAGNYLGEARARRLADRTLAAAV
jgi:AcrR family transcriptional regulator